MRWDNFVKKQIELLMGSKQRALLCVMILALLPYCAWLAMILVALVTLRKGEKDGARLLLVAMIAHSLISLKTESGLMSVLNTSIFFVPCYISACVLRKQSSWQAVAAVLFFQVTISALLVQVFVPEWVLNQYAMIQSLLKSTQSDQVLAKWLQESSGIPEVVMANYAFGIQLMSAVISGLIVLILARSFQSRLYYPGGFTREMLMFRGNSISVTLLVILSVAAWHLNVMAMNVLPVLILFYLMAGLSFCANLIVAKTSRLTFLVLIVPLFFLPFVMLPLYVMVGLIDSVCNLRLAFCR